MKSIPAADADAASALPTARWVMFVCDGQRFGIRLDQVSEIVPPRPFTRLPGAGPAICGLIGLRGRVVTVVDAGTVLGMRASASLPDHRLLLLELGSRRIGLAVEEVTAVAPARLEPPGDELGGRLARAVVGTARVGDAGFVALDPDALLMHLLG
jgi:purine-binding chemotaxis protein CheW